MQHNNFIYFIHNLQTLNFNKSFDNLNLDYDILVPDSLRRYSFVAVYNIDTHVLLAKVHSLEEIKNGNSIFSIYKIPKLSPLCHFKN